MPSINSFCRRIIALQKKVLETKTPYFYKLGAEDALSKLVIDLCDDNELVSKSIACYMQALDKEKRLLQK